MSGGGGPLAMDERKQCESVFARDSIREVGIGFVSELCQIRPQTPVKPRDLRGHFDAHRCCGKSLIGRCVGAFRCASARAGGINFQACSFNHSAISPLESTTCGRFGTRLSRRLVALPPQRSRRSSTSDTMNPNPGQPPDWIDRSNHRRACALSPRTRYQLPRP